MKAWLFLFFWKIGIDMSLPGNHDGSWLTTWKSIAAYCDVSIDTVRRWEKLYGFPVFRLPSKRGFGHKTIAAIPSEINTWLREFSKEMHGKKRKPAKKA